MGCQTSSLMLSKSYFHQEYVPGDKLGQGSFGQVRVARQRDLEEAYVVKIVDARLLRRPGDSRMNLDASWDFDKIGSFMNECEMWTRVGKSTYCVELLEVFAECGMGYAVMERCECSLFDKLTDIQMWTEFDMRCIFRDMLLGIEHVHSQAIAHRDIKPDNFLYGYDKVVKLADFDLSVVLPKPLMAGLPAPGLRGKVGTVPYMSPELLMGKRYGLKTDVWSYGVSVYLMTYGCYPYGPQETTAERMVDAIVAGSPPTYDGARHAVSGQQRDFVKLLLDRSQESRCSVLKALASEFLDPSYTGGYASEDSGAPYVIPMVQEVRKASKAFAGDAFQEPMVETDLDHLLTRFQQESKESKEGSSMKPRKSASSPTLDVAQTLALVTALRPGAPVSSLATIRRARTVSKGWRAKEPAKSKSSEAILSAVQSQCETVERWPSSHCQALSDWSEEAWSDDYNDSDSSPSPPTLPPRLPPCHAAAAAATPAAEGIEAC